MGAKYCDEYVSLSVRSRNSKTAWPNFTKFLSMLPMAVAWSSSDGVAIHNVLAVLWLTPWPCFHTIGPMDQNQAQRYV